jgi:hypothetical protein
VDRPYPNQGFDQSPNMPPALGEDLGESGSVDADGDNDREQEEQTRDLSPSELLGNSQFAGCHTCLPASPLYSWPGLML